MKMTGVSDGDTPEFFAEKQADRVRMTFFPACPTAFFLIPGVLR